MNRIERYMQIPREQWKRYRVYTNSCGVYDVAAPNKTMARIFMCGQLNVGVKIVHIEEV